MEGCEGDGRMDDRREARPDLRTSTLVEEPERPLTLHVQPRGWPQETETPGHSWRPSSSIRAATMSHGMRTAPPSTVDNASTMTTTVAGRAAALAGSAMSRKTFAV